MKREKIIIIKTALSGYPIGAQVKVPVDEHGVLKDQFWRRRLRDSKIDNCIEIKEEPKKEPKKEMGTSRKKTKPSRED